MPDKFRGTLPSREFVELAHGAIGDLVEVQGRVVSDGGEGLLDAMGGHIVEVASYDALGRPIMACYSLLEGGLAVVEMSRASGMELIGSAADNDAVAASTFGTGVLMRAAIDGGASKIIVGCGGSATTDGGIGALEALDKSSIYQRVSYVAAVDVRTRYLDAAEVFAPQKGASPAEVAFLRRRLAGSAALLAQRFGRDVTTIDGSGAAGGLAGMVYAIGGEIIPGFEVVAEHLGLAELFEDCDLVVTGEGLVDAESFNGKVVGSVLEMARRAKKPVLVVCGSVTDDVRSTLYARTLGVTELVATFGASRAMGETASCVANALRASILGLLQDGDWGSAAESNSPGN